MSKRSRIPKWILEDEEEVCGGCFKVVEYWQVEQKYDSSTKSHQRFHKCRHGETYQLASEPPKARIIVCAVRDCDSARLESSQQWQDHGKAFAVNTKRSVGSEVCWKHQPGKKV